MCYNISVFFKKHLASIHKLVFFLVQCWNAFQCLKLKETMKAGEGGKMFYFSVF